jgi:aldehyde dehydrogenase (NAD+)
MVMPMPETAPVTELHDITKTIQIIKEIFKKQTHRRRIDPIPNWSDRKHKLRMLEKWILAHRSAITDAVFADFKKPPFETESQEIFVVLSELRHAIRNLKGWVRPRKVRRTIPLLTHRGWIEYVPKGLALIISTWNYPFQLTIGPLISAITAGNRIILKPSEFSMNTSQLIKQMIGELYPADEIAVICGHKEAATELLKYPFDHIFFTGSSAVGKIVMSAAAKNLTSITLELGGKSPAIIEASANLADAAEKIVWGKFMNAGQSCVAPDYLLVPENQQIQILELLKKGIHKYYGDEETRHHDNPDMAAIIDDRHLQRLKTLLQDAIQKGANVETGGISNNKDRYIPPTFLSQVHPESQVMQEEIFGPVLPVIPYQSLQDAIQYINERGKPLAVYVFSRNKKIIREIFSQTSSGGGGINELVIQFIHPNLPFGGVRESGFGNAHGFFGFRAFSHEKAYIKGRSWSPLKLLYPPYTEWKRKIINVLVRYF